MAPALAIADVMAAELVLFRVAVPVPRTRELARTPALYNDLVSAAYREAADYLEALRTRLRNERVSVVSRPGSEGVARQIVDYATQSGVDLIVMSSHGRSRISRWVRGSIAEKVLSGATCSILVVSVRGNSPAAQPQTGRGTVG